MFWKIEWFEFRHFTHFSPGKFFIFQRFEQIIKRLGVSLASESI